MIVTFAPTGGTQRRWDYKSDQLSVSDAEAIEDVTGYSLDEFTMELMKGRVKCKRAVLWTFLKQDNPSLKFAEVDFKVGELVVEFDREEKALLRAEVEKANLPEVQKAQALRLLTDDEDEPEEPVKAPKKSAGVTNA